jgi:hypothetical protein
VRPTESNEINTKTTKRLPTTRPIISFINTPHVPVAQQKLSGRKYVVRRCGTIESSINSLFYVKKGEHWSCYRFSITAPLPDSRTTSRGFLSSLNPTNFECLICPSGVHSVNSICATSAVRTTTTRLCLTEGEFNPLQDQRWAARARTQSPDSRKQSIADPGRVFRTARQMRVVTVRSSRTASDQ